MNLFSFFSSNQNQKNNDTSSSTLDSENVGSNYFMEMIRFTIIAILIVVPIRWFIAQPFIVSGASMENTFHNGEYLIVDQISYYFNEPQRGDVVIFRYPKDPNKFFIKRIIGLPGETIEIKGNEVIIYNRENPEGFKLEEPYVKRMSETTFLTTQLGQDEYFVMGDNRDHSSDSRTWGVLTKEKIIGKPFIRLFPISNISLWPGHNNVEGLPASIEVK